MICKHGPLTFYRLPDKGYMSITLTAFDNAQWGWEFGWRDDMGGVEKPWVDLRIGKLRVLAFEKFKEGFEVWLMGFWWIK